MSFTIDELLASKAAQSRIISELRAKVTELETDLGGWPLHGEGRLTKAGWALVQDRYRHVCETLEEFRRYWTELQVANERATKAETRLANLERHSKQFIWGESEEGIAWADDMRTRTEKAETELAALKDEVHGRPAPVLSKENIEALGRFVDSIPPSGRPKEDPKS